MFQADEQVVSKGLEDNPVERNALRSKPGSVSCYTLLLYTSSISK